MAVITSTEIRQSDNRYIRKAMQQPLLEREHEVELAVKWRDHDDDKAMHHLVMAYARLVVSAASKYRHYGLPNGDLIQEGNIGLMQAAKRFDPDKGVRFSTYAAWWIKPLSKIIFCATGQLCVRAQQPRINHYSLS